MRKLVISMNVSLDGYLSGPNCELDWHFERWSPDMGRALEKELGQAGSILLGRKTWEAMSAYWPSKVADPCCPRGDIAFAAMMNSHHKIVYSNTLKKAAWSNSKILKGDLEEKIKLLKSNKRKQGNIIIYGSGQLAHALIRLNLVDEFQLWVHPLILGKGKVLFDRNILPLDLKLLETEVFLSGVVLLKYQRQQLPITNY